MFRQYTKCYVHTPGDKPFNESDLLAFAAGTSAPGLIVALISFLSGADLVGFIALAIQYAVTITAIANEWLYHRLVCISGNQCAVGTIDLTPTISPILGAFDNDQFFDIRLMPHRYMDFYRAPNCAYATLGSTPWQLQAPPQAGPSLDGQTESHPANDVFLDNFQGSALLQPGSPSQAPRPGYVLSDLPYDPVDVSETTLQVPPAAGELARTNAQCTVGGSTPVPGTPMVTRASLHCEAEGNFWAAMKATAALQGLAVGVGAAAGAAAGAALGCAIGGLFGGIGCLIGAIIGFIAGLFAGAAGGAYLAANAAFNSDPGNVNDANVGDTPLGPLQDNEQVVVYGTHVYDGFHSGWHEFHPLMAIMKAPPTEIYTNIPGIDVTQPSFIPPYIEWSPNWTAGADGPLTSGLTVTDMQQGLASPAFRAVAVAVKQQWCSLLGEAFSPGTIANQNQPENGWTIHPTVDGCGTPPPSQPPIQ